MLFAHFYYLYIPCEQWDITVIKVAPKKVGNTATIYELSVR